ncbi:hypothetical protein E2562_001436 [Oryza meyeriana var. granulata]|uniref:Uncharacterized protein n=1 Tax=Oryza meyeriana var. granulata TaxID=110450 RepID=A0A6G1DC61_9ORYZ|nr:hypothetical protein E2562_001436 [Oryza meyeriana var. granulata]
MVWLFIEPDRQTEPKEAERHAEVLMRLAAGFRLRASGQLIQAAAVDVVVDVHQRGPVPYGLAVVDAVGALEAELLKVDVDAPRAVARCRHHHDRLTLDRLHDLPGPELREDGSVLLAVLVQAQRSRKGREGTSPSQRAAATHAKLPEPPALLTRHATAPLNTTLLRSIGHLRSTGFRFWGSLGAAAAMASKQILKELKDLQKDPPTSCSAVLVFNGGMMSHNWGAILGQQCFPPDMMEEEKPSAGVPTDTTVATMVSSWLLPTQSQEAVYQTLNTAYGMAPSDPPFSADQATAEARMDVEVQLWQRQPQAPPCQQAPFWSGTGTEGCGDTFFSRTYPTLFCRKGLCREYCDNEGAAGGSCISSSCYSVADLLDSP